MLISCGWWPVPWLLPATKLSRFCYSIMFANCPNVTTVPVLPATELTYAYYSDMFTGYSNLTSITCLATYVSIFSLGD